MASMAYVKNISKIALGDKSVIKDKHGNVAVGVNYDEIMDGIKKVFAENGIDKDGNANGNANGNGNGNGNWIITKAEHDKILKSVNKILDENDCRTYKTIEGMCKFLGLKVLEHKEIGKSRENYVIGSVEEEVKNDWDIEYENLDCGRPAPY